MVVSMVCKSGGYLSWRISGGFEGSQLGSSVLVQRVISSEKMVGSRGECAEN